MAGIETEMSCQEVSEGVAWIEFPNVGDVLQFLNIVATYEPGVDTLYNRINHPRTGQISAQPWKYQLNILDFLEDQQEQKEHGLAWLDATVGVYFPRTDIEVIVARLDAYNIAQNVTSR